MTEITNPHYPILVWFEHYEACRSCRSAKKAGGDCSVGAPLRFRALATVEKIAWNRETDGPIDKLPASTKQYLVLPSEAKLDIEFVIYGLHPRADDEIRRAVTTIAVLSFSHGKQAGMERMAVLLAETIEKAKKEPT